MQLVQRWWNGKFGRIARRDVWLHEDSTWRVQARQGDGDSPTKTWTFTNRGEADAMNQRLLTAEPTDTWRDISSISTGAPVRGREPTQAPRATTQPHRQQAPDVRSPTTAKIRPGGE